MYPSNIVLTINKDVINRAGPYSKPGECPVATLFKEMFPSHKIIAGIFMVDVENLRTGTKARYLAQCFGFREDDYINIINGKKHNIVLTYNLDVA